MHIVLNSFGASIGQENSLFAVSTAEGKQLIAPRDVKSITVSRGARISSDAVLCPDDPEFLDYEQGIPHFKGFPGRVVKMEAPPEGMSQQVLDG